LGAISRVRCGGDRLGLANPSEHPDKG
jgi:hypothetical protein